MRDPSKRSAFVKMLKNGCFRKMKKKRKKQNPPAFYHKYLRVDHTKYKNAHVTSGRGFKLEIFDI